MRFTVKHLRSSLQAIAAVTAMFACGAIFTSEVFASEAPAAHTTPAAPTSSLFVSSMDALTVGITPAYSVFGTSQFANARSGGLGITDATNVSSEFNTAVRGGTIGLFGDVSERPSLFALAPAPAWNMGGSLGYAGFYLRAGLSETPQLGPFQRTQGWQAGLGFASGGFDVRLMFLTAQTGNFSSGETEMDSQRWMVGGIYRLSSSLRLNADAFYGLRDSRAGTFFTPAPAAGTQPPQGTGARVGVQLRF